MPKKNYHPQNFAPEILEIEEDLVDFLVEGQIKYSGKEPILSKCMAYFFTRKKLTQKNLQNLTGFSAGTISKTIRQLIDLNLVQQEYIEGTHKHIYTMDELPYAKPSYLMNVESLMGGISVKLETLKKKIDELQEFKDELERYENVNTITTQLLGVIRTVPRFVEFLKKELEEYLKQYPEFAKKEEK